jgi:hypothetical protein
MFGAHEEGCLLKARAHLPEDYLMLQSNPKSAMPTTED